MHLIALEQEPTSLRGGQELNLLEICHSLSQRGHQITLLYEREGNLLERYQQFCDHTIRINSYGFDRRRIGDVINFFPSLASLPKIPIGPDSIVFSNAYHAVFYGWLLAAYRKLPLVCYLQVPPFDFNRQRLLGLKHVQKFIAVSQQTKQNWAGYGYDPNQIEVVLNGTDTEKFKPAQDVAQARSQWNVPAGTKVISYAGRLDKEKGLETLLQAFAFLLKRGTKAQLLIAGKPVLSKDLELSQGHSECLDYQGSLEQLALDLGIADQVRFLGHTSNTSGLYQASDVTVVPSIWDEPFGRVIIESMACGTPVVASKVGGIPEVLTGEFANHLVAPGDERDLAETISKILDWRETDPKLSQRCRDYVLETFSIDRMVDGIEQVLLTMTEKEVRQAA